MERYFEKVVTFYLEMMMYWLFPKEKDMIVPLLLEFFCNNRDIQ